LDSVQLKRLASILLDCLLEEPGASNLGLLVKSAHNLTTLNKIETRTEGFVLSPPGQGDFVEAVIADLGPMQPLRIPALSVECFDRAVSLLGDRLPRLLQCLCHLEVVGFFLFCCLQGVCLS
jgi:hypothetical protein